MPSAIPMTSTVVEIHPYHGIHIPKNAPFELKSSPGKGWGVFATRVIKRGEKLLTEKPLFILPEDNITDTTIQAAVDKLPLKQKNQFLCLRDNSHTDFSNLEAAFNQNIFGISKPGEEPKWGLYLLSSRFNHSCIPNSQYRKNNNATIQDLFATKDIKSGEEITFCYKDGFEVWTREIRHQRLGFECGCKACLPGTPFQTLSDERRTLLRGLSYLVFGSEWDSSFRNPPPLLLDEKNIEEAEEMRVPMSKVLVYGLMALHTLEQEGILNQWHLMDFGSQISDIPELMRRESNKSVAELALSQEGLEKKLKVALRAFGKLDSGDEDYIEWRRRKVGLEA